MPLLALFLIRASAGYQFQAVAGAAPLLVAAGYDYAQVGLLVGAYMLPGILVTVPAGYLSRTLGDQRVLTAGLFLMMAGTGLMAVDDGFAWLLAGRILSGTGGVVVLMLVIKMTADRYAGPWLSTATAVVITSWYAGFAAALLGSAWIAAHGGARLALIASGVPAILGLLMVPFVGKPKPLATGAAPSGHAVRVPWRFTASASLCWMQMNIGFAVIVGFLPAYLVALGWQATAAGARASVLTWSAGVAAVAGGYVADRVLGRARAVVLGAASCALLMALLPVSEAALLVLIGIGLSYALFPAALTAQVGEATPQAARGEVFGWYSGASYVGLTVSPWMAGALRDATGNPAAPIYLAAAVLALLLPAYAWFCRETGRLNSSPTAPA